MLQMFHKLIDELNVVKEINKKKKRKARHPGEATIFSAEAKAIELAFEHIKMS